MHIPVRTDVRIHRSAVIASTIAALAALGAVPAHAASTEAAGTNTATAAGICGSGYTQIDSHAFLDSTTELGRVYLLYNASTKSNCVVTLHSSSTGGFALPTGAWLDVDGDGKEQAKAQGTYSSYAGPVRLAAGGRCVKWGGMIEAGVGAYTFTSPWEHCG
ncbi:hypothetical protein ACFU8W_48275 [Streptomyces sp. NPDC057565]|uniref:hypothetical protein n=1 Tax=Streptomyces sp. NPDC057565 TaxID=3346169 RepID=UPI0036C19987